MIRSWRNDSPQAKKSIRTRAFKFLKQMDPQNQNKQEPSPLFIDAIAIHSRKNEGGKWKETSSPCKVLGYLSSFPGSQGKKSPGYHLSCCTGTWEQIPEEVFLERSRSGDSLRATGTKPKGKSPGTRPNTTHVSETSEFSKATLINLPQRNLRVTQSRTFSLA